MFHPIRLHGPAFAAAVLLLGTACGDTTAPSAPEPFESSPTPGTASIVNGTPVSEADFAEDWPFAAVLVAAGSPFCSASVLADRWVVTAGHCAEEVVRLQRSGFTVSAGVGASAISSARLIGIADVHIHPGYDPSPLQNDIALLELSDDAAVPPARLPTGPIAGGAVVEVAGWGITRSGGQTPASLREVSLVVIGPYPGGFFMAAAPPASVCTGDSGGPAVSDGALVGVHSFSAPSCDDWSGHVAVFDYLGWIELVSGVAGGDRIAPVLTDIAIAPVAVGTVGTLEATADDEATGASTIAGSTFILEPGWIAEEPAATDGAFDEISEAITGRFLAPETPGVYQVCLSAQDAAGNTSAATCAEVAVYDPSAGFVTGAGWIEPAATPGETARFTFVARYKRGATRPDGTTRFRFSADGLDFRSSAYDWLVVNRNGANAQFKGTGTIEGRPGEYDFMLWAGDSDGGDTFRIRIWRHGEETDLVYDNEVGEVIAGGSVIIHTGK